LAESALSSRDDDSEYRPDLLSVLKFEIGGKTMAVAVDKTEGVVDCPRITPLPSPPDGMVGVASVRGRMTLVMDLSLEAVQRSGRRRLILLKSEGQLGLLADRVDGLIALQPGNLRRRARRRRAEPNLGSDAENRWAATLFFKDGGELIPILNIDELVEI
jgi:chemotaxis signal transduction protein